MFSHFVRSRVGAAALALTVTTAACASHGRNWFVPAAAPPDAVYTCVLRQLGEADFTIVAADRASGFVHAKRVERRVIQANRTHEIYATVIPDEAQGGSRLQITGNAYSVEETESIVEECSAGGR